MPELPEVETMVRGIRSRVEGALLEAFTQCPCSRRPITISPDWNQIARQTAGQKILEVTRLAKRVILRLQSRDAFVIEPRMTGLMLLGSPPSAEHLRYRWDFRKGKQRFSLWFWDRRGLGTLRLYTPEEFATALGANHLGPDALLMTPELWQQQLARTGRPIKVALLDQKLVAGIGNLYASEILHVTGLSPLTPANQLSKAQIRKLHAATQRVLTLAIEYEGSTLSDGTYRNALNSSGGYQNEHRVYDKAGERCQTCGKADIQRLVQAQRSTFYCPRCQP